MEMVDRSGQPVTEEELNDAIYAVGQILVKQPTVLPLFTVNGMAIRRALLELRAARLSSQGAGVAGMEFSTHQKGVTSIENLPPQFGLHFGPNGRTYMEGDFETTVGVDGRVWVNINGVCFIRFKPLQAKGGQDAQDKVLPQ